MNMPNYCDYSMSIVGDKKENIEEFVSYLKATYSYDKDGNSNIKGANHHFFRVFEACESTIEHLENGDYECVVDGYCAWSVYSCMLEGEHTYYDSFMKDFKVNPQKAEGFRGISLPKACAKLNVNVEIFSKEPGCGFMEHIICRNGEIDLEECYNDYCEVENEDGEWEEQGGIEWDFTI